MIDLVAASEPQLSLSLHRVKQSALRTSARFCRFYRQTVTNKKNRKQEMSKFKQGRDVSRGECMLALGRLTHTPPSRTMLTQNNNKENEGRTSRTTLSHMHLHTLTQRKEERRRTSEMMRRRRVRERQQKKRKRKGDAWRCRSGRIVKKMRRKRGTDLRDRTISGSSRTRTHFTKKRNAKTWLLTTG